MPMVRYLVLDPALEEIKGWVETSANYNVGSGTAGHSKAYELVLNAIQGTGPEDFVRQFKGMKGGFAVVRLHSAGGQEVLVVPEDGGVYYTSCGRTGVAELKEKYGKKCTDTTKKAARSR